MKDDRDLELEELLSPLREKHPSKAQLTRWQNAVSAEVNHKNWLGADSFRLIAASLIGFLLGAATFGLLQQRSSDNVGVKINSSDVATYHYEHIKLD